MALRAQSLGESIGPSQATLGHGEDVTQGSGRDVTLVDLRRVVPHVATLVAACGVCDATNTNGSKLLVVHRAGRIVFNGLTLVAIVLAIGEARTLGDG